MVVPSEVSILVENVIAEAGKQRGAEPLPSYVEALNALSASDPQIDSRDVLPSMQVWREFAKGSVI